MKGCAVAYRIGFTPWERSGDRGGRQHRCPARPRGGGADAAALQMPVFGSTRIGGAVGGVTRAEVEAAFPDWAMPSVEPAETTCLGWPMSRTSPQGGTACAGREAGQWPPPAPSRNYLT
jgi:hypothetical protein